MWIFVIKKENDMLSFKFLKKIRLYTSNKAGQGMIEYTLLLALFVVVGYTFFASGLYAYTRMQLLQVINNIIKVFSNI